MREFKLYNRYRVQNSFVEVAENEWVLKFDNPKEYDWCRVGLKNNDDKNDFSFIDPSGGPFISLGDRFFEDLVVERIIWRKTGEDKGEYVVYTKKKSE